MLIYISSLLHPDEPPSVAEHKNRKAYCTVWEYKEGVELLSSWHSGKITSHF